MMCRLNCTENQIYINSNSTDRCELLVESSTYEKCIKTVAYSVIMLISLFGNLAIILIVSKNKRMRTTTNCLIANMATSDLLTTVLAVPRVLVEIFAGPRRWLLGGLAGLSLCKVVYFFQDLSIAVSIQSLVVIAIDRYQGIVFPFRPPIITCKICKAIIPVIWIVAMLIHGWYFYTARLVEKANKWYCIFSWAPEFDDRPTQERYYISISVLLVFLPLCVILILYVRIVIELKKRKLTENGAPDLRRLRQREDMAIMKRIAIIVFLFVLCITPITVSVFLYYFVWDWHLTCGMNKLFSVSMFIFHSNAALNPLVYITLNENYRQGLKHLAKGFFSSKRVNRNNIEMNVID